MRLHRKGQRMLGSGRVRISCYGGPLHGEEIWVPEGTTEFFSIEPTEVALTPNDLLPIWRYSGSRGTLRPTNDDTPTFWGHRETEI